MDSMSDIKHRIRSISQTQQITRAMHLISVSKMRKALAKHESNAAVFYPRASAMKDILMHTGEFSHPFLKHEIQKTSRTATRTSSSRGIRAWPARTTTMCSRWLWTICRATPEKYIFTVGQVARSFFTARDIRWTWSSSTPPRTPSLRNARQIAET